MINEEEVQLSRMSYTNKDFASLYPDLLDLAKNLTNRWDPSLSNESDPGVVLLKEGAFIADHNNYNIDKNILEAFLPSATQDRSVRNITEMNGYTPRYYVSATGDVVFSYDPKEAGSVTTFTIPAFTIVVTNEEENIAYTQISDLQITTTNTKSTPCTFIEGTLNDLTVNSSTTILLENIDENNRVYFPDPYVAQNGVYIRNKPSNPNELWGYSTLWERNNYLLTQPIGSKVYKIDFDSAMNLPYIEFPSDIASLIENGLEVRYISTSGKNGNIRAGELTKIQSPDTYSLSAFGASVLEVDMDDFTVSNQSSIVNGKDPETISEMYQSFKRIVGTFDTLVTCRDYSNAVYSMEDDYSNPLVSNVQVTDRRIDYNRALNVITYDEYGEYFKNISLNKGITTYHFITDPDSSHEPEFGDIRFNVNKFEVYVEDEDSSEGEKWETITDLSYKDFTQATERMSQFDLCIYALKAFSLADFTLLDRSLALNNSFKPISSKTLGEIESSLEEYKCINHSFVNLKDDEVYCFKNYVPLRVSIIPYSKVTLSERNAIINNVYYQLTQKFNSRMLTFGEELSYDEVVDEIINADPRIKNIRLEDFEYNPVVMTADGKEYDLYSNSELLVDLVAKNVLAGRLCLFSFDETFNHKFGQNNSTIYSDIVRIETSSNIPVEAAQTSTIPEQVDTVNIYFDNVPTIGNTVNISINNELGEEDSLPSDIDFNSEGIHNIIIPGATGDNPGLYTLKTGEMLYISSLESSESYYEITEVGPASDTLKVLIYNRGSQINGLYYNEDSSEYGEVSVEKDSFYVNKQVVTKPAGNAELNLDYTIRENEYVQLAYPNYYSTAIYPSYCYYRYTSANNNTINANTDYKLQAGDTLVILYTESSAQQTKTFNEGDVVRPNFTLVPTDNLTNNLYKKTYIDDPINQTEKTALFAILSSNEQISSRELINLELTSANTPCYWIVNNSGNILFEEFNLSTVGDGYGKTWRILGSGEYFIYSNSTLDSMTILGAGTRITRSQNDTTRWINTQTSIDISTINNEGYNSGINWIYKDFSINSLLIQEMNLVTLGENCELKIAGWSNNLQPTEISNSWSLCDGTIYYKIEDQSTILLPSTDGYLIRSRLDLNTDKESGQRILEGQKISIVHSDSGESPTIITPDSSEEEVLYIQTSMPINLVGDTAINISDYISNYELDLMSYAQVSPMKNKLVFEVYTGEIVDSSESVYYYRINGNYYPITGSDLTETSETSGDNSLMTIYTSTGETSEVIVENNGQYVVSLDVLGNATFPFAYTNTFNINTEEEKECLIPVYLSNPLVPVTVTVTGQKLENGTWVDIEDVISIEDYNTYNTSDSEGKFTLDEEGMYLLQVNTPNPFEYGSAEEESEDVTATVSYNLTMKFEWNTIPSDVESITVHDPVIINGINNNFVGDTINGVGFSLSDVLSRITELISNSDSQDVKPYYINVPEKSIAIEDDNIYNPNILWDKNNVANIITIPQIDLDNSDIDVIKSMKNYSLREEGR